MKGRPGVLPIAGETGGLDRTPAAKILVHEIYARSGIGATVSELCDCKTAITRDRNHQNFACENPFKNGGGGMRIFVSRLYIDSLSHFRCIHEALPCVH